MKIEEIPIEKITSNPSNPREKFDREKIDELAESIKTVGLKVPIIVRPKGKQFEIISGERRWTAAKEADLKKVTVIIKELDDKELAIESLIANEFRENLDPWERAKYLKRIKKMTDAKTDIELGKLVGMSQGAIASAWTYLDVDEEVKEKVIRGELPQRAARDIGRIPDKKTQRKVADIAVKEDMTLRETESLVSTVKKAPKPLKEAVLKQEVPVERAKEAVEIYDKVEEKTGQSPSVDEVKRHIEQIKIETVEDKLHEGTRKRAHERVLSREKEGVDIDFEPGEANEYLNEVRDVLWKVKAWGVPTMMVVGEKAWNDSMDYFRQIRDHMDMLLG